MLNVAEQRYVGEEAFKAGADILTNFFKKELEQFLTPDLDPLGRKIIESFIAGESIEELNAIMPGKYIK